MRVSSTFLTFARRDEKVAAVTDVAEIQVHHGSRVSGASERNLSQVIGSHCSKFFFFYSISFLSLRGSLSNTFPFQFIGIVY